MYKEAIVFDFGTNVKYQVDKVSNQCIVQSVRADYDGHDIEPLQLLWPTTLQGHIKDRALDYLGVRPCRRMPCDVFQYKQNRADGGDITFEYDFLYMTFHEQDQDVGMVEHDHSYARVTHHHHENNSVVLEMSKSVDIYDFTPRRGLHWEYEIVAPCYSDVSSQWHRIYLTANEPEGLNYIHSDFYRVEVMEQLRRNASNVSPLRIGGLVSNLQDDNRIQTEFLLRGRHPADEFRSPSLDDASESIGESVLAGDFTVTIKISDPVTLKISTYTYVAEPSFETCKRQCSVPDQVMPVVQLDVGSLVGTIIGSILGGLLVIVVVLTLVVSSKHNVSMKSLYFGPAPGASVGMQQLVNEDRAATEE